MPHFLSRTAAAAMLIGVTFASPGCSGSSHSETPVRQYTGDDRFPVDKAREDGDYVLYLAGQEDKPVWSVTLKASDDLGFSRETGKLFAIAGHDEKRLPEGKYVWKRK